MLNEDANYAKAGHEIYRKQLSLSHSILPKYSNEIEGNDLTVLEDEKTLTIKGKDIIVVFDKGQCVFQNVMHKGKEVFSGGEDNFYRPVTGIDEGTIHNRANYAVEWKEGRLDKPEKTVNKVKYIVSEKQVFLFTEVSYNQDMLSVSTQYRIGSEGIEIQKSVINNYNINTIPRIGMTLIMPGKQNKVAWYGRGPWENYSDRKESAFIGSYESTVGEQYTSYIKPVECGGKEDVRHMKVTCEEDIGIQVMASEPFHFDIHNYSIMSCDKANYERDLEREDQSYLNLDYKHAGLGGDNGWTKTIHSEYWVEKGYYQYQFNINFINNF